MELLTCLDILSYTQSAIEFFAGAEDYLNQIGIKEFKSAIRTLSDISDANDFKRELASTITQLRLAYEKFSDDSKYKFQTSALIALCYKKLDDNALANKYVAKSCEDFSKWLDKIFYCPSGKYNWRIIGFMDGKEQVEKLGIPWNIKTPSYTMFEVFSDEPGKRIDQAIQKGCEQTNEYYRRNMERIIDKNRKLVF